MCPEFPGSASEGGKSSRSLKEERADNAELTGMDKLTLFQSIDTKMLRLDVKPERTATYVCQVS